jgi:hypothetical protein
VLYVGSIFNRRRLRDLIRAFAIVARTHTELRLEIVGDDRSHPHEDLPAIAAGAGVADRVNIRAYVPDAALADLYSRAAVFAFLSEYEGFGLTPLEAMAHGVPPLVLDTPVAREIYGDAAMFVPREDLEATADAIRRLLFDAQTRASLLARAPAVLGRYSWQRTARETLAALESAARRPADARSLPPPGRPEIPVRDLAIIIVSYNARGDLEACLASLHDPAPRIPHEVVVVDNASTDGSSDTVRQRWPAVRVIDAGGNLGFSRATNIGIRATEGRLVLCSTATRVRRRHDRLRMSMRTGRRGDRASSSMRPAARDVVAG